MKLVVELPLAISNQALQHTREIRVKIELHDLTPSVNQDWWQGDGRANSMRMLPSSLSTHKPGWFRTV